MALTKIKADGLTADLIDETKLADNSIDSEHYNDGSIDNAHLADDAVGTAEIADDAVTADKLANAINTDIAAKAVLTGSTDNTITTVTGANAIQGEANLTFDGSELTVTGDIHVSDASPGIKFTDTDASGGFGMVGVNNTSGSLVLRSDDGNALSSSFMGFEVDGGEKVRIHSNGAVSKGQSPAFAAHGSNAHTTLSHSSSAVTIVFGTELYDAGANYNTSTSTFTAPVSGIYQFHVSMYMQLSDHTDSSAYATLRWNKNGSSDNQGYRLLMYGNLGKDDHNHTDMMTYSLSANDYVTITLESEDQDVLYYGGHCVFTGFLIG